MSEERPIQKTLFAAPESRGETAPATAARVRTVRRASATSDVTRFGGIAVATIAGGMGVASALLCLTPAGGLTAPGPLSRPHIEARLECTSCHRETSDGIAIAPARACAGCHGPHESARPAHRALASSGKLGCSTCHGIHRDDRGVTFGPDGSSIRFGPGVASAGPAVGYRPSAPATVALVTARGCETCHDPLAKADPVNRCLVAGQEPLGSDRSIVCFDEHRPSLPPATRSAAKDGAVCAAQHGDDRTLAWQAARESVAAMPTLSPRPDRNAWTALLVGSMASAVAFGAHRAVRRVNERRRARVASGKAASMVRPPDRVRLPQINENTCIGCYACVDACPYDVIEIERYVAKVTRPDACCGLSLCEQRCPNGSLVIAEGPLLDDRPGITATLESNDMPGVFLAGDVTGLPLIKNAIVQGGIAIEAIAASLRHDATPRTSDSILDVVIVGAGPAGISAALKAKELRLSYVVVEQGSVAESIRSFPRGKLVFDPPLELPLAGKLWLKESSKEELLAQWLRVVRKEQLPIREATRMVRIERDTNHLRVDTAPRDRDVGSTRSDPATFRARRVLVAIGRRGSPRRLPFEISESVESRVHYHLSDARSFAGQRVVVVGLGDVAMETVAALAGQPDTRVTVVYRGDDFRRGKSRNIEAVRRLLALGRIEILFQSEPVGIDASAVRIRTKHGEITRPYDAVMVMIGSIPPWDTLQAAGIARGPGDRTPASRVSHEADHAPDP